jgi:hypothetical protein
MPFIINLSNDKLSYGKFRDANHWIVGPPLAQASLLRFLSEGQRNRAES